MGNRRHADRRGRDRPLSALIVIAVFAVLVLVTFALIVRLSRRPDGVAEFQRQIDALSPEARRPVVDQVQQLEEGTAEPTDTDDTDEGLDGKDRDGP